MHDITKTEPIDNMNQAVSGSKQYLINNEKYQLIRQFQNDILQACGMIPTTRKIINELITTENLEKLKANYDLILNY